MATIDGNSLGKVQNESQTKDSNLFMQPLPYSDSVDSILMDLFGTGRTITIEGKITGDKTALQTFVGAIEGIQDGRQSGSVYVGDLITSNKTVLIQTFNWNYQAANVGSLPYTLTLMEGTVI